MSRWSAPDYHPAWGYHGLIVGTVEDAARLLWLLTNGHLLQPTTLAAMMQGRTLPAHRLPLHPDPAYGLGLMLTAKDPANHPPGHSGEGLSKIAVYAKGHKAAAVWTALPSEVEAETQAFKMLT